MSQDERTEAAAKAIATSDGWQHPAPRHFKQATAALAAADSLAPDTPTPAEIELMIEAYANSVSAPHRDTEGVLRTYYAGFNLTALSEHISREMANRDPVAPDTAAAVEAERERCAKIADIFVDEFTDRRDDQLRDTYPTAALVHSRQAQTASDIAAAIRKAGPA